MGDLFSLFDRVGTTPLNTVLLVALGLFLKSAVNGIYKRLDNVERRDRKQDLALARIEERLGMAPLQYDDDQSN